MRRFKTDDREVGWITIKKILLLRKYQNKFTRKLTKGDIVNAIKLLTGSMQNDVISLNEQNLKLLKQKYPQSSDADPEVLF